MQGLYPSGVLNPDEKKCSVQSLIFGHRIKPQETRYEFLVEFLQVAMAHKRILENNKTDHYTSEEIFCDLFPINEEFNNHTIEYIPISNMGLKRFIFFDNSRLDTKSRVDKEAYKKCVELLCKNMEIEKISEKESIFVLQNILYGFSIENAGRSWFNKNLLPICAEVLFPESLARKVKREGIILDSGNNEIDSSFDFNSYTYMARGGEIYYLHLLHAINNGGKDKKECIENGIKNMLNSIPQISKISKFIQRQWVNGMDLDEQTDAKPHVKKRLGAIPLEYRYRDNYVLSELSCYLSNRIQPMEKLNILSYGIVFQLFRLMITTAAVGTKTKGSAFVLDLCENDKKEQAEIRKLAMHCYNKNEESITKYIDKGIEYYFSDETVQDKDKRRKDADKDTNKVIRKLGKNMGIIIPINGPGMRFTLSEEIIKFLVMSLIPPSTKVTFDYFLDMMYDHFELVITPEHYIKAQDEGKVTEQNNTTFLNVNKSDFAQKLKKCGFLRDLSDATAIVENPYEREDDFS